MFLVWIAGIGVLSALILSCYRKIARLAGTPAPAELQRELDACRSLMGVRRAVRVETSTSYASPAVRSFQASDPDSNSLGGEVAARPASTRAPARTGARPARRPLGQSPASCFASAPLVQSVALAGQCRHPTRPGRGCGRPRDGPVRCRGRDEKTGRSGVTFEIKVSGTAGPNQTSSPIARRIVEQPNAQKLQIQANSKRVNLSD